MAYVGNVAFEALPTQLKEVFAGCEVSFVRLHTDKESGKSKGFAHVHFADEASLDRYLPRISDSILRATRSSFEYKKCSKTTEHI